MDEPDVTVRYMTPKYARVETLLFKLPDYQNDLYGLMVSALEIAGHEPHWFKIHSKPKSTYRKRLIEALQKKSFEVSDPDLLQHSKTLLHTSHRTIRKNSLLLSARGSMASENGWTDC